MRSEADAQKMIETGQRQRAPTEPTTVFWGVIVTLCLSGYLKRIQIQGDFANR
jgi:hypothetical protein